MFGEIPGHPRKCGWERDGRISKIGVKETGIRRICESAGRKVEKTGERRSEGRDGLREVGFIDEKGCGGNMIKNSGGRNMDWVIVGEGEGGRKQRRRRGGARRRGG